MLAARRRSGSYCSAVPHCYRTQLLSLTQVAPTRSTQSHLILSAATSSAACRPASEHMVIQYHGVCKMHALGSKHTSTVVHGSTQRCWEHDTGRVEVGSADLPRSGFCVSMHDGNFEPLRWPSSADSGGHWLSLDTTSTETAGGAVGDAMGRH